MATVPTPSNSPRPSGSWAGLARILSRPSRAAGPWEGRLPSHPGRGGSGNEGPRSPRQPRAPLPAAEQRKGSREPLFSHPELGRPRKRHTSHPRLNRPHLASSPLAGAGGLGRATCVPRRVCAPRPWGGAGGLRAIDPLLLCSARRPGAPGFLSRPLPRALSPPRALPAASPCPRPSIGLGRDYTLGARAVGPVSATLRLDPKSLTT